MRIDFAGLFEFEIDWKAVALIGAAQVLIAFIENI